MTIHQINFSTAADKSKFALRSRDRWELVFESWTRVIRFSPIENKPRLLFMMARDSAAWAAAVRQQAIDDTWELAEKLGLVGLLGPVAVQDVIATAFDEDAS
jgi:hypothetical protein